MRGKTRHYCLLLRSGTPLLCGLLLSCGGGEVDREDELGMEAGSAEKEYELVIIEVDSSTGLESGVPPSTEEVSRPDEAMPGENTRAEEPPEPVEGTDELIIYDPKGPFTVQVGVYRDGAAASEMVRVLSAEGYPAYAIPLPDKKGVRVRIGYFNTRDDAGRFAERLKKDRGLNYWIDLRTNEKF